ncbi:MAG TPA: heme exporter protein CcmD [Asticcacaulis sp.]|nr:heme exporter protein CcmD [Asticcacaulis sp.]
MHLDFDMGRYGFFVWGAYGASVLAIGGLILASVWGRAERLKRLTALQDAVKGTKQ